MPGIPHLCISYCEYSRTVSLQLSKHSKSLSTLISSKTPNFGNGTNCQGFTVLDNVLYSGKIVWESCCKSLKRTFSQLLCLLQKGPLFKGSSSRNYCTAWRTSREDFGKRKHALAVTPLLFFQVHAFHFVRRIQPFPSKTAGCMCFMRLKTTYSFLPLSLSITFFSAS